MRRLFSGSRGGSSSGSRGRGFSSRSGFSSSGSLSGRSRLGSGGLVGYKSSCGRFSGLLGGDVRNTSIGEGGSSTASGSGLVTDSVTLLFGDFLRNLASSGGGSSRGSAALLSDTTIARLTVSQKVYAGTHAALLPLTKVPTKLPKYFPWCSAISSSTAEGFRLPSALAMQLAPYGEPG